MTVRPEMLVWPEYYASLLKGFSRVLSRLRQRLVVHYKRPAHVFKVDPTQEMTTNGRLLKEVCRLPHPCPEAALAFSPSGFHRGDQIVGGLTLNTISWHEGGIIYGTSRGLIVMIQPDSKPIIDPPPSTPPTPRTKPRFALSARSQELVSMIMRPSEQQQQQ